MTTTADITQHRTYVSTTRRGGDVTVGVLHGVTNVPIRVGEMLITPSTNLADYGRKFFAHNFIADEIYQLIVDESGKLFYLEST